MSDTLVSFLAPGCAEGSIRLWTTDQLTRTPAILRRTEQSIEAIAFSPDGRWLAVGSCETQSTDRCEQSTIRLWALNDLTTNPIELTGYAGRVSRLVFSPKADRLAVAGEEANIKFWALDPAPPTPIDLKNDQGNPIYPMFISDDGRFIIAIGADAQLEWRRFDDLSASARTIALDPDALDVLSFSPDGRWLAQARDDLIKVWSLQAAAAAPIELSGSRQILRLAFSPDGQWLAALDCSGGGCGGVSVWPLTDLASPPVRLAEGQDFFAAISFSPDGRLLAATNCIRFEESQCTLGAVQVWAVDHFASTPMTLRHSAGSLALTFSPDGHYLVVTSRDGSVSIWNLHVDELMNVACRLVNRNFTRAEWDTFFFGQPYRKTCEQWPEGE